MKVDEFHSLDRDTRGALSTWMQSQGIDPLETVDVHRLTDTTVAVRQFLRKGAAMQLLKRNKHGIAVATQLRLVRVTTPIPKAFEL